MIFDIFLPCAPKDYNKLPYVVASIAKYVEGYNNIFICSPINIPHEILKKLSTGCYIYLDRHILDVDRSKWKHRSNWCYQQHLKLFQNYFT